ncbi:MAG: DNA gyrase modulator, partial [Nitrosopumilus sp.]
MDSRLQDLADEAIRYAIDSGAQYCDARAELQERKSALIENGEIEHVRTNKDEGIGIRLVKEGVWSFCSITNPKSIEQIKEIVNDALRNSSHYAENKKNKINLYSNSINKIKIDYPVLKKPELEELIKIGFECDKIISDTPRIIRSVVNPWYTTNSKYFVNSEGSEITQNFTDVVVDMVATAHESGLTQSINITEGGRGGMEQIINDNKIQQSAKEIALKASQLIDAKPAKEE